MARFNPRNPVSVSAECGKELKVTTRKSRIRNRPIRQHQCSCGKVHLIDSREYKEVQHA